MPKVWGQQEDKRVNVTFNDLGQPNDKKVTSTLAHFLGTIARLGSYCPLHYKDWRLMPYSYKEEMLKVVKSRFNVPPGSDGYLLASINHKWRNLKSEVKKLNFNPEVPIEHQLIKVPDRVNADQYKKLLDYWFTDEAQIVSEKNKKSRAKLEILHRMGKQSYAVIRETMKTHLGRYPTRAELFEQCCYVSDGSPIGQAVEEAIEKLKDLASHNDEISTGTHDDVYNPDDDFAKVMGKDKGGRVRMYGIGVKATDVYGGKPSYVALSRQALESREEIDVLKEQVAKLTALVEGRSSSTGRHDLERATFSSTNNQSASGPSSIPRRIRVGSYVKLKSLVDINEIVATGIVREIGGVRVNGRDLGPGICEVVIQSTLKNDEMLIYPHSCLQKIGDCWGATVAWPLSLVVWDDDEN